MKKNVQKKFEKILIRRFKNQDNLGAFNNYVDRILSFFDPPPLRGQFLYPERGQRQNFFDPLPPLILST